LVGNGLLGCFSKGDYFQRKKNLKEVEDLSQLEDTMVKFAMRHVAMGW